MLQTAPVATAGTYSLVVGGVGGTTGNYTLQAILNAVYKQATDSNNSIGIGLRPERRLRQPGHDPGCRPRRRARAPSIPPATPTYYKFFLNAGQSTTLAAAGLNGGQVSLGLFDGSGNLLALPSQAPLCVGPLDFWAAASPARAAS